MAKGKKIIFNAKTKEQKIVEYEYTPPTKEELRIVEIKKTMQEIKSELDQTDYKAIKYAEGQYTEEEYANTKKLRQDLRNEYNALEAELETLN